MKALLVNPWIYDFAAFDLWSKPLGLLTVAAGLRQLGVEIRLIDCLDRFHPELAKYLKGKLPRITVYGSGHYYQEEIEKPVIFKNIPRKYKRYGLPLKVFKKILREEIEPDIILVTSGMTYWYPGVFDTIRFLRERFPGAPIVLGGIYARLCARHAEQHSGADQVYSGGDIFEITRVLLVAGYFWRNTHQCRGLWIMRGQDWPWMMTPYCIIIVLSPYISRKNMKNSKRSKKRVFVLNTIAR